MNPHQPFRRHLLTSFLATLFAHLWPSTSKASTPLLVPVVDPAPYGYVTTTVLTYDAYGRCVKEEWVQVSRAKFWSHLFPNKRCIDSGVAGASFPNC